MPGTTFADYWASIEGPKRESTQVYLGVPVDPRPSLKAVLATYGVREQDIIDKSHIITFPYAGLVVTVIDQDDRLVGQMHRPPSNDLERRCVGSAQHILNSGRYTVD